jgi:DNA-binding NarL/FixJ family response regulator
MVSRRTIVIADDHHIVREGLRALLEAEGDLVVVEQAADGVAALDAVARCQPDVLILDLAMPGVGGLEVLRRLDQRGGTTRVVVLSMHASEAHVVEAMHTGASAYVLKTATAAHLVQAVREVLSGRRYLGPPLSEHAIDAYTRRRSASSVGQGALTARESEILALAAQGHTVPQIATTLGIGPRTVETHRANLMRKLGLRSQTDLVRFAVRTGILPSD